MAGHRSTVAVGFVYFAAIMMMIIGVMDILQGIAAIARQHFYAVGTNNGTNYVYKINVTTWGWINLVLGVLLGVTGIFLLRGALWARIVGVVVAALVMISNFMWLPYYPVWAIILIAASALVIWALALHGDEVRD